MLRPDPGRLVSNTREAFKFCSGRFGFDVVFDEVVVDDLAVLPHAR